MDSHIPPPQKKGLGPLAWVGIGCGGLLVLAVIAFAVFAMLFAPKMKKFVEEAQSNPTKSAACLMVSVSAGQIEMVSEDDANLRYTVKHKKNGKLTTVYFNKKKNAPEVIEGDFSAIPANDGPVVEPMPAPAPK